MNREPGSNDCASCDVDANEWAVCTGRPGCVRAPGIREEVAIAMNAAMGYPPPATSGVGSGATPIMPDGWEQNAQPTDPLLLALSMGMKVGPAVAQQAAAEIARLRAEVERLTIHAARLEDRRADLAARVAELEAENERLTGDLDRMETSFEATVDQLNTAAADRAALAQRVAEAVRDHLDDTVHDAIHDAIGDVSERDRVRSDVLGAMRAADLGPIVATAIKKEGG